MMSLRNETADPSAGAVEAKASRGEMKRNSTPSQHQRNDPWGHGPFRDSTRDSARSAGIEDPNARPHRDIQSILHADSRLGVNRRWTQMHADRKSRRVEAMAVRNRRTAEDGNR